MTLFPSRPREVQQRFFLAASAVVILFWLAHLLSLPLLVTYDGLGYLDMASVLFSSRFPADWVPVRGPLLPLALRTSFEVLGRQALSAIVVPSAMALLGILVLGAAVRRTVGDVAAGCVILIISVYPTLVAYEHSVLTETGSFFFLAVTCALTLYAAKTTRALWIHAILLGLVIGTGYYWRQTLQYIALPAAFLHTLTEPALRKWRTDRLTLAGGLTRTALIVAIPLLAAKPWDRYADSAALRDLTLRQGMIRQALIPPQDPYVAANEQAYIDAIRTSLKGNNFYSGVTWPKLSEVSPGIYAKPMPGGTVRFFLYLVRTYPWRYLNAVGRSILFFAGVPGVESDNRGFRNLVLWPGSGGSMISEGPQPLQATIKTDFRQATTDSLLLRFLSLLVKPYDAMVLVASGVTLLGLVAAVVLQNRQLACFCLTPLFFLGVHAAALVTIDRFMVPIYPILLGNCLVVPLLVGRVFWRRRADRASSAGRNSRAAERPVEVAAGPSHVRVRSSHKFDLKHRFEGHPEKQNAMLPSLDIGIAVGSFTIADRHAYDLEIILRCAKN